MEPHLVAEVVEAELGAPPGRVFARFSTIPIAAASIGQVHAATLDDGTEVAVKVQYPGVADAIRADLSNTDALVALLQMARRMVPDAAPNVDPRPLIEEVRDRIGEELDYRAELANQQRFRDLYEGHETIRIPFVLPELSTARVLTMEMVDGRRWPAAVESEQSLRDRWGHTISRFVYGSLYMHHVFNGDPHPGNYLFHEDGTVTFLDFGCVKSFAPETVDALLRIDEAVLAGDAGELVAELQAIGMLARDAAAEPERVLDWYRPTFAPVAAPQPFRYTREFAASVVRRHYDPFGDGADVISSFAMPRELVFLNRILIGLYSVQGGLRATNDWVALRDELLAMRSRPSPRP